MVIVIIIIIIIIIIMEKKSSSVADTRSFFQEIHFLLCNPNFHCCILKSPPLFFILSQMNPVHNLTSYFST
jgi:hypothetical protein